MQLGRSGGPEAIDCIATPPTLYIIFTLLILVPARLVLRGLRVVVVSPRVGPSSFVVVVDLPARLRVIVELWNADARLAEVWGNLLGRNTRAHAEECLPGKAGRHGRIDFNQFGELCAASEAGRPPDSVDD